jgi:hypothetical protein
MAIMNNSIGNEGTPTYLDTGDPDRKVTDFASKTTAARDYLPVWLNCMADDVTLEGALMNGAVRGAEAARAILGYIRTLYEDQHFSFAGPYGDDGFLEVYNTRPWRADRQRRPRHPQRRRSGAAHRGQLSPASGGPARVPASRRALRR